MEQNVTLFLQGLADKLGVTTMHILEIYEKQARISSIIDISVILFLLITFSCGFYFCYRNVMRCYEKSMMDDVWSIGSVLLMFSIIVLLIISCLSLTSIYTGLYNPEYVAINRLLSQLK